MGMVTGIHVMTVCEMLLSAALGAALLHAGCTSLTLEAAEVCSGCEVLNPAVTVLSYSLP